jgi:hypothetical protein
LVRLKTRPDLVLKPDSTPNPSVRRSYEDLKIKSAEREALLGRDLDIELVVGCFDREPCGAD